MRKVHFDFETRSLIDLDKTNAFRYAEDSSTEVLCLGYAFNDELPKIWAPGAPFPTELVDTVNEGALFYAHNTTFDYLIWNHVLCRNSPSIPKLRDTQLRDVMAMAAVHGLPMKLEKLTKAMGLPESKDSAGKKLINKLCKPNKKGEFHEDEKDLKRLQQYCRQDVVVERIVAQKLSEIADTEQKLWLLSLRMNAHGIPIDTDETSSLKTLTDEVKKDYDSQCVQLTGLHLTQKVKLKTWLNSNGCPLPNLQKETIKETAGKYGGKAGQVIDLIQTAGGTATDKFNAMLKSVSYDHTLKGQFRHHGAATGRFSSVGINIQNLARPPLKNVVVEDVIAGVYLGESQHKALTSCVRSVIKAPVGKTFINADFSSIENRVAYWIVGDEDHLGLFRENIDEYMVFASMVTGKPYDEIDSDTRQHFKVAVLGCMYGAGVDGFIKFAEGYSLKLSTSEAQKYVNQYRANHPKIVGAWNICGQASVKAVREGKKIKYGQIIFDGTNERVFSVILPSGRKMIFQKPYVAAGRYGGDVVRVWAVDTRTKQWTEADLYTSRMFQNIVQATARDLLVNAIFRVPDSLGAIVGTFHDEILILTDEDNAARKLQQLQMLMSSPPEWATDLPLKAKGWEGNRYRK